MQFQHTAARRRLRKDGFEEVFSKLFQHTAARRRLPGALAVKGIDTEVSTHSRPKAAAGLKSLVEAGNRLFQHTAARRRLLLLSSFSHLCVYVSTHSRPKAAAAFIHCRLISMISFNTQPPEGGCAVPTVQSSCNLLFQHTAARRRLRDYNRASELLSLFQHTAARRRLRDDKIKCVINIQVSTHSRPKAAA